MSRPTGQGEKTKRHIAGTARDLFEQQGYGATSMEAIATAATVSKGNIYYHFKSKEDLFLYIYETACDEWRESWRQIAATVKTAREKLYRLADFYAIESQSAMTVVANEFATQNQNPEITAKLLVLLKKDDPVFREILAEGMERGEFRSYPLEALTSILASFFYGLGIEVYMEGMEAYLDLQKTAVDFILQGLQK